MSSVNGAASVVAGDATAGTVAGVAGFVDSAALNASNPEKSIGVTGHLSFVMKTSFGCVKSRPNPITSRAQLGSHSA
jgi:hypothetical protein